MPAEFQVINERVCLVKFTDPLLASDMNQSTDEVTAYAETATEPLLVIGDCSDLTRIPTNLISIGLRQGRANPLRYPVIEKIILIAHLPIIMSVALTISNILGNNKIALVQTQAQAEMEIEAFLQKHKFAAD